MLKDKLLPLVTYINDVALEGLNPGEIGFLRLVLQRMRDNLTCKIEEGTITQWAAAGIET